MPSSPQPRRDPFVEHDDRTGRAVFVAPRREERPGDAELALAHGGSAPGAWCPFCAGNEARTPPDVLRAPADPARAWQARIVPNRYPFVEAAGPAAGGDGDLQPARGVHDVVIESPHPSPLSAHRGFFGSRPFSRANAALVEAGREPVDWRL